MMRIVVAVVALFGAMGCDRKAPEPKQPDGYALDVEQICFAEERSGALQEDENRRSLIVAQWLASNVETAEARQLLGELGALAPRDKGARLRAAAAEHGIETCPTADSWK